MEACARWIPNAADLLGNRAGLKHGRELISLSVLVFLLISLAPGVAWGQEPEIDLQHKVKRSFHGAEGQAKEGPLVKIGEDLIHLYHEYEQHRTTKGAAPFSPSRSALPVRDERWVVVDAVAQKDPETLRARLEELGLRKGAVAGRLVSGLVPIEALDEVAKLEVLREARPALSSTMVGATTSQGDVSLRTDSLRDLSVLDGTGVKVGVLSDSYNDLEGVPDVPTAADDVRSGDLPGPNNSNGYRTPVEVIEEGEDGSDEGRAMMQIIHDVAPRAELAFHTAFNGLANFARGIRELADAGSEVIVDDIFYFSEPFFQDGVISQAIQEVVDEGGIYVTSAGNSGEEAYESEFRPSGEQLSVALNGDSDLHDFDPGPTTDTRQQITVPAGQRLILALQWDDPYASVSRDSPGADTDLDMYLHDGTTVVTDSETDNIGGDPVEWIDIQNTGRVDVELDLSITRAQGPVPERLKYVIFQGGQIDEYRTNSSTMSGHSTAAGAISVAAAAWFNTPRVPTGTGEDPPLVNAFSAKGGTPILFDVDGNRRTPEVRPKPDVTGPDGVNTTFFGIQLPSQAPYSDLDDDPNFFGTSAAAPHIAAVAALMREARPGIPAEVVREQMKETAHDIRERYIIDFNDPGRTRDIPNGEGDDVFSGSGLVQAVEAVLPLLPVQVADMQGRQQGSRDEIRLDWSTVKETNSRQFLVEYHPGERLENPELATWRQVGTVGSMATKGESTDTLDYFFESAVPSPGRYVFRLRHEQQDGTTQRVGPRVVVNVPFQGAFEIGGPQPNPTRGSADVQLVVEETQSVRLDLYDSLGRRIRTLYDARVPAERPLLRSIDTQNLASGSYFLHVVGETFTTTRRLVRIR